MMSVFCESMIGHLVMARESTLRRIPLRTEQPGKGVHVMPVPTLSKYADDLRTSAIASDITALFT